MRTIERAEAIADIRKVLLELVDDEHSMCEVAANRGIYCTGFKQYDDAELFHRYDWIAEGRGVMSREELERRANRWQLARQTVQGKALSCDVQSIDHDTCDGWETHTNHDLERYHRELCGEEVIVTGPVPKPRARSAI